MDADKNFMQEHVSVSYTSVTSAFCVCPCGNQFTCDSLAEENVVWDEQHGLLRGACKTCGRLEPAYFGQFGVNPPKPNRIQDFLR